MGVPLTYLVCLFEAILMIFTHSNPIIRSETATVSTATDDDLEQKVHLAF